MKFMAACGSGLGSSFMVEMNINKVLGELGVSGVEVRMTFDPPWTPDRMSEEAQVAVGWY